MFVSVSWRRYRFPRQVSAVRHLWPTAVREAETPAAGAFPFFLKKVSRGWVRTGRELEVWKQPLP